MIKKKICMVGAFAVGKTSLVQRFVHSMFSEKYLTTIGVKVDRKVLDVEGQSLQLLLWDIEGQSDFGAMHLKYLRGASGIFLVADGTRQSTLDTALGIRDDAIKEIGEVPMVALVNKSDLQSDWEISDDNLAQIDALGISHFMTSAKEGTGVEEAFHKMGRLLLDT